VKVHPVADLFPMLSDQELQGLANSIKEHGLIHPCIKQGDVLLDGRNRLKACKLAGVEPRWTEYDGDSPTMFIATVNLERRHLDTGQKAVVALELRPHFEAEAKKRQATRATSAYGKNQLGENLPQAADRGPRARDLAAQAVGVSGKTLDDARFVKENSPELFEKIRTGKVSVNKAKTEVKKQKATKALKDAQANVSKQRKTQIESVCDMRVCSCAELFASGIKPDAVITDPPYPREFLPVFSELAECCARAGVPLVAVMSGQSYLPEVMQRLCEHLEYRWTLAYMTPGGQAVQQWSAKVNTFWKPVLVFGTHGDWFGDVAISGTNDNDKRFHGWGQSESGMADLVGRLSRPGQTICDPFLGGGTTAVVSLALGRKFIGCDIDKKHVETARARVLL